VKQSTVGQFASQPMRQLLNGSLILIGLLSLIAFGIIGVGRSGVSGFDGAYIYAAGRAWLSGSNPYDHASLIRSVAGLPGLPPFNGYFLRDFFAYPPQVAVFAIPLGMLSYPMAKVVWLLLNLAAVVGAVVLAMVTLRQTMRPKHSDTREGLRLWRVGWKGVPNLNSTAECLTAALILGNPFTTHVVWMGQSSLIALTLTYAAWVLSGRRQWLAAGLCLGVASFKPQICLLVGIWFCLQRAWKVLAAAGAIAVVASLYPIAVQGLVGVLWAWFDGLQHYKNSSFNAVDIGNNHVVGLQSLLQTLGLPAPNLGVLGIAIVVGLWIYRQRLNRNDVLGILMATTLTFVYAHDYDYVCLLPAFVSLIGYGQHQPKLNFMTIIFAMLLFFPQRWVRTAEIAALNQWRTVVIVGLLIALIWLSSKLKPKQDIMLNQITF
jgi:hypothetical protein